MSAFQHATLRVAFALLCLTSWFVMSNHCGLEALVTHTASACPHCAHGEKAPAKTPGDCCLHLKLTAKAAFSFQAAPPIFASADSNWLPKVADPAPVHLSIFKNTCGPPTSFISVLLTRSLPAHAPPLSIT